MLAFYSRVFPTIEVDATFYGIPAEPVLRQWREQVSGEFQFALKVPQQITHERRLIDVGELIDKFVQRVAVLEDNLGPLLIQLSPDFLATPKNRALLKLFVPSLPLAVRWAIEFRSSAWLTDEILEVLDRSRVALTLTESRWHRHERMIELASHPTADFAYVRWMGQGRRLTDYSEAQIDCADILDEWTYALHELLQRVERVFGYANNQFQGHSPHSVRELQRRMQIPVVDPSSLHPQTELFAAP
jgi:uncharacterized protein YecE (DUF72 family)